MITIQFFDKDGDICGLSCIDRKDAIEQFKSLVSHGHRVIGWFFTPKIYSEEFWDGVEYYPASELIAH